MRTQVTRALSVMAAVVAFHQGAFIRAQTTTPRTSAAVECATRFSNYRRFETSGRIAR